MSLLPVLQYDWPFDPDGAMDEFVVIVAVAPDGRVVFVRSSEYGRYWELPGGRIRSQESPCDAAVREMREETGLNLELPLEVAIIQNMVGKDIHSKVKVVSGSVSEEPIAPIFDDEIVEYALWLSTPQPSTFDAAWVDRVIALAMQGMSSRDNMQLWDRIAGEYDHSTNISETVVHYGPLLPGEDRLNLLPDLAGARVLDLGCGAGQNLAALKNAGARECVGVDISLEQVAMCRARLTGDSFKIVQADMATYPIEREFDLVLSVFSLAFVADVEVLFKRIFHALSIRGRLVFSTDYPDCLSVTGARQKSKWQLSPSRQRYWTSINSGAIPYQHHLHSRADLLGALDAAGFEIEHVLEPSVLPIGEIDAAPYRSRHYLDRYDELRVKPYTLIIKARRPH